MPALYPDEPTYLGMPEPFLLELGKLMAAAGQVEWVADEIGLALGQYLNRFGFKDKLRVIEAALAGNGLPPWATTTNAVVVAWCSRARTAITQRDELVHSTYIHLRKDTSWETAHVILRDRRVQAVSVDRLRRRVDQLSKISRDATELLREIRPLIRPGVYYQHTRLHDGDANAILMQFDDGTHPDPSSIDEVVRWYDEVFYPMWIASGWRPDPDAPLAARRRGG